MFNKKKIFIFALLFIIIIIIGLLISVIKSNKKILEVCTLNQQGLMKNSAKILDEKFDDNGNLLYYKYKPTENSDAVEFNFRYQYDDKNRIISVSLDDRDYVLIEYDQNNKIKKIVENILNPISNNTEQYEFLCTYLDNDDILIDKKITFFQGTENEYLQNNRLSYKNINYNNKNCILLTEFDNNNNCINEILYEKNSSDTNYNNFYNLINIVPLGYCTIDNSIKYTQETYNSLYNTPVFFNGNIIYSKNYLTYNNEYTNREFISKNYYDKMSRLLKQESTGYNSSQITNIMYKSINSKEYYEYRIIKNTSNSAIKYTYIQYKIYLNDNNVIFKKETLKSNVITEKEYNSKLKQFEKYFEKENCSQFN